MIIKNTIKKILVVLIFIISISSGLTIGYSYFDEKNVASQDSFTIADWLQYGINYDFTNTTIQDLEDDGAIAKQIRSWEIKDNQLYNTKNWGNLFIPYTNNEYTISVTANLSEGTNGGYGIFFETTLKNGNANKDTGYVLQFDRGYSRGAIIIRQRVDGNEFSPSLVIKYSDSDYIPSRTEDPTWWASTHTIDLKVEVIDTMYKKVIIFIDSNEIGSFTFEYDENDTLYTGVRVWSTATYFDSITVS